MAYARISEDSDVYLISDVEADWLCVCCRLAEMVPSVFGGGGWYGDSELTTIEAVKLHMLDHVAVGHAVPDYCLKRINDEISNDV